MPTRKASKKSAKKSGRKKDEREDRKKSGGTKSGGKMAASSKTGGKKTGVKKAGAKKSAASAKGGKKATAKGASRKTGAGKAASRTGRKASGLGAVKASKAVVEAQALTAAEELKGDCLDFSTAGFIVENAVIAIGGISPGDFDIDKKLEQMGVFTPNKCTLFKQRVLDDVRIDCDIDDGDVPNAPGDKARTVRDSVKANARKKPL